MSATGLTTRPVPFAPTLVATEGSGMAERTVEIDGRTVRVGTFADAGRLCVTDRSPNGVSARTYQFYSSPRSRLSDPAPGALQIRDTTDPKAGLIPYRDAQGRLQVDLDAVQEWNRRRPGDGAHGSPDRPETATTLRRSPLRERMLVAARDRALVVVRTTPGRWQTWIGDEQLPPHRAGQIRGGLHRLELVVAPDPVGPDRQVLALLPAGAEVLTRWGLDQPER